MVNLEIESCILKYLSNSATKEELDFLSDWILIDGNQKIFDDYIQLHLESVMAIAEPDTEKIKNKLIERIKAAQKRKKYTDIMKYAAVVLLLLNAVYFYNHMGDIFVTDLEGKQVTVILENGGVETFNGDDDKELRTADGAILGTHSKQVLSYNLSSSSDKLEFNTLKVPYGKKFEVVLSDGSHIHMNSGSSLRYPQSFLENEKRVVFLNGEAFFEVAKDSIRPFVVNANEIDVQVLGTKFNVSNYSDNSSINAVLVEGSVQVHANKGQIGKDSLLQLLPGFKAEWNKGDKSLLAVKVDTEIYTSWIRGELVFQNTPFFQIRKSLERHFDVQIINDDKALDKELFNGSFQDESITEIMELFSKSYDINYVVSNDQIKILNEY